MAHDPRPVVLYGAGELGQLAHDWCRQFGIRVHAVIDAQAARWSGNVAWRDVTVLGPSEVPPRWLSEHRLLVCISTLPYLPLEQDLIAQGWAQVQPFYDFAARCPMPHPLNNGWHARLPASGSDAPLRRVLRRWEDDISRAHHLQFIAWRCCRLETYFDNAPIEPAKRYAEPAFMQAWRSGERVLDAGAHHGQVLGRWLQEMPGRIDTAWAVEPDPANHATLVAWHAGLTSATRARVQLSTHALGSRSATLPFVHGQGYGSRLWAAGAQRIPVRAVDALGWKPSVVKLHLEGYELPVLRGAAQTLREQRPLLALTVYHQRDGLWATADWLMGHLQDYHWRFRLHGWQGTAALVYGIPMERQPAQPRS